MTCTSVVNGRGIDINSCGPNRAASDATYSGFAELVPVTIENGCPGLRLYLDGVDQGHDATYYPDAFVVSTTCPDPNKYDCINGACVPKRQYNTLGLYQSLADCQAVCANGGACASGKQCVDPTTFIPSGKVCMDQGEFDSIEALISKIGSEVC